MSALVTAVREVWGLFVDDGKLALGLVVWCAIAGLLFRALPFSAEADALLLASGCVAILVASVFATPGRRRPG